VSKWSKQADGLVKDGEWVEEDGLVKDIHDANSAEPPPRAH
jgi:hypothetical protein